MIYGHLDSTNWIRVSEPLDFVMTFLRDRAAGMNDGRHELPRGMYAEIKKYNPVPASQRFFESHVKYVDVQCVLDGEESILVRPQAGLSKREDLLEQNDIAFYNNPDNNDGQTSFIMRPGNFLLLLPGDAHKTECQTTVSEARKVIYKIPIAILHDNKETR